VTEIAGTEKRNSGRVVILSEPGSLRTGLSPRGGEAKDPLLVRIRENPAQSPMLCAGSDSLRSRCQPTSTPRPPSLCKVAASTTSRSRRFLFNVEFAYLRMPSLPMMSRIMRLQVIEQAAPFADEHQEAAP